MSFGSSVPSNLFQYRILSPGIIHLSTAIHRANDAVDGNGCSSHDMVERDEYQGIHGWVQPPLRLLDIPDEAQLGTTVACTIEKTMAW